MTDKLLPHDTDAEEAVLGSLLLQADIKILSIQPADFYSERNRWVFECCKKLSERGVSINQITLAHELAGMDKLEAVGGAAYLSHLIVNTPTSLDMPYYADIVKKLSMKRRIIQAGEQISRMGYETGKGIDDDLGQADDLILNLRKGADSLEIISPEERVSRLEARYSKLCEKGGGIATSTGLHDLDRWLYGGFYPGEFIIIGARAGLGKTMLLQTIANNIGNRGQNVLYMTGEMKMDDHGDRDIAGLIGEPVGNIRRGDYNSQRDNLYCDILVALEQLKKTRVHYVDGVLTLERIRQAAISVKARYGLAALVVDYLGLIQDSHGGNETQRISYISRSLKQISMELDIPLIAAHQLNRALESREDKHPQLYDLRDSGSLEQDANVVLLVYRASYYGVKNDPTTEIIIAKSRQGVGNITVKVYFDQQHLRYASLQGEL